MAADIKTELKIPDLWYDLYTRLLPGVAFVFAIRFWSFEIQTVPIIGEILVLVGLAYLTGIIIQPISVRIVELIVFILDKGGRTKNNTTEKNWIRTLQFNLGRDSRDSLIISKMRAEAMFFVQMALLVIIFGLQNKWKLIPRYDYTDETIPFWISFVLVLFFISCAFELTYRRIKKAKIIKEIYDQGHIKNP